MKKVVFCLVFLFVALFSSHAHAMVRLDVVGNATADESYAVYVSTSENDLGTLAYSYGTPSTPNWESPESVYPYLTTGVKNYLHVVASNSGDGHPGFLASFELYKQNYLFQNGTTSLVTDTSNWTVYTDHFGGTLGTLESYGTNGSSPWGNIDGINNNASWIWTNDAQAGLAQTRYFSTEVSPAPEPVGSALFLIGGVAIAFSRKNRKKK